MNIDAIDLKFTEMIDYSKQLNAIKSLEILCLEGSKVNTITIKNIDESIFSDNLKIVISSDYGFILIRKI